MPHVVVTTDARRAFADSGLVQETSTSVERSSPQLLQFVVDIEFPEHINMHDTR